MIENVNLENILANATDIAIVCELYGSNAVPSATGFDPAAAIDCFAAVAGITFRTRTYKRLVKRFGSVRRTITAEVNSTSVEFSNNSREISQFEFANGFEGLILVVRLISRSLSVVLGDSQILFVGRCEKPRSGNKNSLTVPAKFILGSLDVTVPRRKFTATDQEGRVTTDPEFEGFNFIPQYGTTAYSYRTKRGGLFGILGFKKTVKATLHWSSFSDLDANKPVPEVWGRAQILLTHIGYDDLGTYLRLRSAACEGEISDLLNVRAVNTNLVLHPSFYLERYGKTGTLNSPDEPIWVAPGFYSKTAFIRVQVNNSTIDVVDAAPDVAAQILGRLMLTPDGSGNWVTTAWTDNGAAHARFVLTSQYYFKLDPAWIDDASFNSVFAYNAEQIFNSSVSDFLFVEAG